VAQVPERPGYASGFLQRVIFAGKVAFSDRQDQGYRKKLDSSAISFAFQGFLLVIFRSASDRLNGTIISLHDFDASSTIRALQRRYCSGRQSVIPVFWSAAVRTFSASHDRFDRLDLQNRILKGRLIGNSHVTKTQLFRFEMAELSDRQLYGKDSLNPTYANKLEDTLYYRGGNRQLVHRVRHSQSKQCCRHFIDAMPGLTTGGDHGYFRL